MCVHLRAHVTTLVVVFVLAGTVWLSVLFSQFVRFHLNASWIVLLVLVMALSIVVDFLTLVYTHFIFLAYYLYNVCFGRLQGPSGYL